jgi:poly(3-hydroxybutyrate) depolymerase
MAQTQSHRSGGNGNGSESNRPLIGLVLLSLLALLALSGNGAAATSASPADAPLYEPVEAPGTLNYLLHLPAGYEDSAEPYPLLFFLHGIGQKGGGSSASLERVARHGPFRAMREGRWDQRLPFIVVGPQSSGIHPWWRGEEVRALLDHLTKTYRIDPGRRYLSGISMGGRGVWWLAKNFSNEFAALVPVSGWAGDLSRSCDVFRGMAVWAFHGEQDPVIGVSAGKKPIEVLQGCTPEISPRPHITLFDDAGHGRWRRIYESEHYDSNRGADRELYSDIYRWMLTFSR